MRAGVLQPGNREVLPMKQMEYQIDYHNEPLLILPLSVGALLLSWELFNWLCGIGELSAGILPALKSCIGVRF